MSPPNELLPMTRQEFEEACRDLVRQLEGHGIRNRMQLQVRRESEYLHPDLGKGMVGQLIIWLDDGKPRCLEFNSDTIREPHVLRIVAWIRGTIQVIDQPLNACAIEEFNGLARTG